MTVHNMKVAWAFVLFFPSFLWAQASSSTPKDQSAAAGTPSRELVISQGETLILQLDTPLHTNSNKQGDRVYFQTSDDVRVGQEVAIPKGSSIRATISKLQRPGRLRGKAEIRLDFNEVSLPDGTTLPFEATILRAGFTQITKAKDGSGLKGEGGSGGNVMVVAQGGLQGVMLGGVFGGAKGAAYGGAVGAGVGLASILLQRGPDLDLPRDMLFEVKLDQSLNVPMAAAQKSIQVARASRTPAAPDAGVPTFSDTGPVAADDHEPVPDFSQDGTDSKAPVETASANIPPQPLPAPGAGNVPPPVFEGDGDESGDFTLKVDVQLVMVDAVVRDHAGRLIDNLRRDDFRVFENGVEQSIQSFSRDELPLAVALVVDRSGSVAPFMNDLRRAAYQALSQLKKGDKVALFAFAGDVQRLEDLTTDRQRIANRISSIRAGGGTNIVDALFDATYYLSAVAPDRRRAVILISDNAATTKPRSSQNQLLRMAMETETVIYSVKTSGEAIPLTMRVPVWIGGNGSVEKVVRETGGEILEVDRSGSLDAALGAAVNRLKLRYTIGYNSSNPSRDGAFRKIEIRLNERYGVASRDYTVHARRGYYAPSEPATARKQSP
ncbi:MAG: VWA domain-containing protein [Acidobacteriota bacterium]